MVFKPMKYCKKTTEEHEINQLTNNECISFINEVIERDDSTKTNLIFNQNELIIDLDKAEKIICHILV